MKSPSPLRPSPATTLLQASGRGAPRGRVDTKKFVTITWTVWDRISRSAHPDAKGRIRVCGALQEGLGSNAYSGLQTVM